MKVQHWLDMMSYGAIGAKSVMSRFFVTLKHRNIVNSYLGFRKIKVKFFFFESVSLFASDQESQNRIIIENLV